MRASLLSKCKEDTRHALRMCEDRHVAVNASEASDVSWDKADDAWPSWTAVRFRSRFFVSFGSCR